MATYTQDNRWMRVDTPAGTDAFLLTGFEGEEGLSRPFRLSLELRSQGGDVDLSSLIGKGMTVSVDLADGSTRVFHGIATRLSETGGDGTFTLYRAELRPWLWLLDLSTDCRIFQQKSVPEILEQVFSDAGFSDFEKKLQGTYGTREYCVQYNETDLAFVSRLMEDEGIFYFFDHAAGRHTLVLADDPSAFATLAGAATVAYGTGPMWEQQNALTEASLETRVVPGVFAMDDYDFESPSTELLASVTGTLGQTDASKRALYEYPGGYTKKASGDDRAKLRSEAWEATARVLSGRSNCRAFVSGGKTKVENHPRSDVNADWALRTVQHRADLDGYSNSFTAVPADTLWRAPRTTPRPTIPGAQTAVVVGKSGEEIYTDRYGRIKVQFHWDREGKKDENSSCWIRVASGWAGKAWGMIALPRVGQEVVVSFLDGDPDRPLITGSVYNAEQTVPYGLPDEMTKSTWKSSSSKGGDGFNEMRFEDEAGSEEIWLHAQKDMNTEVENARTATIKEADDTVTVEKGDRIVDVQAGNETHTVAKDYTLTIDGDMTIEVTGKVAFKAGTSMALEAGTSFSGKAGTAMSHEAGTSLSNKAGTTMTNEASISLTNKGSASQTVDGGGMLTVKGAIVKIN